jgi:DNA transposition AAA+ family ATPase
MNATMKREIANEVIALAKATSQNKVATKAGVSSATISQIRNDKWELIADEMWRRIKSNLNIATGWNIALTSNLKGITSLLSSAKQRKLSVGIAYNAGAGKSLSYKRFARTIENVIYIECRNYWSKKSYVKHLIKACGFKPFGTTEEMIETFLEHMKTLNDPLLIIDQFDKLKDPSMDLFMDFYNELEGACGFIVSGVPALEKRVVRGAQRDRIGYRELYSRIGRKFVKLDAIKLDDVKNICNANGVADKDEIKYIFNNSEGDIRRVRKDIERIHLLKTA